MHCPASGIRRTVYPVVYVFLRPQRNLDSIDPQFTIQRKMEQMREGKELVEQLHEGIEVRLKVRLREDLGVALLDGVVLCHLVNHICLRSVASIHMPSPAVEKLCLPHHILEEKGLVKVGITVQALLDVAVMETLLT